MIVRILGEGQFDLPDEQLAQLNELDDQVEAAVEAGDEATFAQTLRALHDGVRNASTPLPADSLEDSDLILPPADATLEEVRELLSDEGLIPG
ncbi:MAG TPA: hypothetical protein VFM50_05335 [Nocardioidaceae bacterium]|jgi:hypothetical protein|nr:hypothetical protein [Nocardioidaceae bacterium]HET8717155.1 hypothetical protein [Nocardioidaceae bacterium]